MKKHLAIILFAMVTSVPALLAAESYSQCMDNCRPGNNPCTQCCMSQSEGGMRACDDKCLKASIESFCKKYRKDTYAQCLKNYEGAYMPPKPMAREWHECRVRCGDTTMIPGNCPGEVLPQKCPYNCQVWNSASKSCIGPRMNSEYCK